MSRANEAIAGLFSLHHTQALRSRPKPVHVQTKTSLETLKARMLAKRRIDQTTGCWLWTGTKDCNGCGQMRFNRTRVQVHRLALALWAGIHVPRHQRTIKTCGRHGCFNPEHTFPDSIMEPKRNPSAADVAIAELLALISRPSIEVRQRLVETQQADEEKFEKARQETDQRDSAAELRAEAKREAKFLISLIGREGETPQSIRRLIGIDEHIAEALRRFAEIRPIESVWVNQAFEFRELVLQEFDALISRPEYRERIAKAEAESARCAVPAMVVKPILQVQFVTA
jgi:hypothetical protein